MKPTIILLTLLVAIPAFGQRKKQKLLDLSVLASSQFDAATTYTTLRSCNCVEGNPLMRPFASNPSIFPVLALSAWGANGLARKLRVHHRKWAVAFQVGVIALHTVAGAHNLEIAR